MFFKNQQAHGDSKRRPSAVLFISGEGGHLAQAARITERLNEENKQATRLILLTDHERASMPGFDQVYSIPTCAPKERSASLNEVVRYLLAQIWVSFKIFRQYRVMVVIVTGPGFAVLPAINFKFLRSTVINIESWSRFEYKSKCSKVMYLVADHFWVQHKELLSLYPKATWVGLL